MKNKALRISTMMVVTACFLVMGGGLLLSQNLKNLLTLWGNDIQLTVYLNDDSTELQQAQIQKFLNSSRSVKGVLFVDQRKALADFQLQLASYAPDIAKDEDLLKYIPASLQVSLHSTQDIQVLRALAEQLKSFSGVEEVSYGQDWVEKYSALVTALQAVIQTLGFVIVVASIFVMSNAIRASIEERHEEIAVLELIGATSSMIRTPFLKEGAILGGASSALAMVLCAGFFLLIKNFFMQKLSFLQVGPHLAFMSLAAVGGFIVLGITLGALASYLCVRRINDGWAARAG